MSRDYLNFATRAANRKERTMQWRDITRANDVVLGDDREASIRGCDLGELRICAVSIGEHTRENHESRRHGESGEDAIKLLFVETGSCDVHQAGRHARLIAGQWCALDKTLPFRMTSQGQTNQLAIALPRRLIHQGEGLGQHLAGPRSFLEGAASVLHNSLHHTIRATAGMGRRARGLLAHALSGLINVAWHADPVCHSHSSPHARRAAVIDFIERNLTDPELDVGRIAVELGYAKRTLHKLFSAEGETLSRIIWQRRLEHCRRELLDPAQAKRSITEIAFTWGFNDSQHFSRSFKARFGRSPRDYRGAPLHT